MQSFGIFVGESPQTYNTKTEEAFRASAYATTPLGILFLSLLEKGWHTECVVRGYFWEEGAASSIEIVVPGILETIVIENTKSRGEIEQLIENHLRAAKSR